MTTDTCTGCGGVMVADRAWRRLSLEQRRELRESGHVRRFGRGVCEKCCKREQRALQRNPMRTAHVSPKVVLEEWLWLASPWRTDAENAADLAPRLGMEPRTLERAVQRLRAKGLLGPVRSDVA